MNKLNGITEKADYFSEKIIHLPKIVNECNRLISVKTYQKYPLKIMVNNSRLN